MSSRSSMAKETVQLALKMRTQNEIDIKDAFCVYDFVEKNGIELKFVEIPSLEGMYVARPKKAILISSLRPTGRQRFTCAHELGHHFLKHGKHIDEFADNNIGKKKNPHEIMADLFASYILMPATTVANGFIRRGWQMQTATPIQIYAVACWLGVGYSTLINHMQFSLKRISQSKATALLRATPKELKKELLGKYCQENVILIDPGWSGRPIDLHIGDIMISEKEIKTNGANLECLGSVNGRHAFKALKVGICNIYCQQTGWGAFIRVSNTSYIGRGKFRHLEDD